MKTIRNKTIITAISALVLGLVAGWLIFGGPGHPVMNDHPHDSEMEKDTVWTCSMHPQIRQSTPGDCPICGMDLIPLDEGQESEDDPMAISMSPAAMQLAQVSTVVVGKINPVKQIRLQGKVQADERRVYSQPSHIPGRIEKLLVNFTGEFVKKGQIIANVYSPDMVNAQKELFEAEKIKESQPQLFEAAKEKLKNWKLTDEQIIQILKTGNIQEEFPVQADVSGYVTGRMKNPGDYVGKGETMYEVADLSRVWILFDVYETDLAWIKKDDKVDFSVQSLPGDSFQGAISFIDPVIDPKTRVTKARVEFSNTGGKLKPEMFVTATVDAAMPTNENSIVVPRSAVMWTGKRSVIYIRSNTEEGVRFVMREVTLGPSLGDMYIIEDGLQEGEEIAVSGTFSIDAAAQLSGKPSMMNPEGAKTMSGHDHEGMK